MNQNFSHTFTFQTPTIDNSSKSLENILYISEEDTIKHFVQYIQYQTNSDATISLTHVNIKVDRSYYLEIANICIDNRERRRHLFSTLGKRRFGATNKHLDIYFSSYNIDEKEVFSKYLNHYEYSLFEPCYVEKTDYSTNKYRVFIEKESNNYLIYLDQLNISSRKKVHKIFCVEITQSELEFYNAIDSKKQQVNYLFNKIGKIYFKSLEKQQLKIDTHFPTPHELALSKLIKTSKEMEKSSRLNDNSTFRKLQDNMQSSEQPDKSLHTAAFEMMGEPNDINVATFTTALYQFKEQLSDINGLKEIGEYLEAIYELSLAGTIAYLLVKKDQDLEDIFLFLLEAFSHWSSHLYAEDENVKAFNIASIDLADALRYFIDTCYKFQHEYKCIDSVQKEEQVSIKVEKKSLQTSAQSYFSEIELDTEVYDELHELERDMEMINYTKDYSMEINSALIHFFEGYTSVLNPLFEFKDFSYSLMLLSQKLSEYTLDENSEMLLLLMKGLITDLLEWKRTVLEEKTAEDIHYMDKSFYSNIAQIEMSLEHNDIPEDDGGMEFF